MVNLWQHQLGAIEYTKDRNSALLMMGVATGKTRTTLEIIKQRGFHFVLVVGTKNSVDTWQRQNELYEYGFGVHILGNGLVKDRTKFIKDVLKEVHTGTVIFVINYEAMIRQPMLNLLLKIPFDCLVFDEVHRLRGYRTKQSKVAYQLAKAHPKAFRIGLTGTIIYTKPLDVFGIFRFIDRDVFGDKWTPFKEQYAIWGGQFGQVPIRYINQDELQQKVQQNAYIVDRHQVLDLPKEQYEEIYVELDDKDQRLYNEFNREFITSLSDTTITARNILDKVGKLQQLTGGFIYQDNRTIQFSHAKINALADLLDEVEDHVVVFYKYSAELDLLRQVSEKASYSFFCINGAKSDYGDWLVSPLHKCLLAVQIASGSEGIDLTKASIVVFYDMVYTYGQHEQAIGRISRTTQTKDSVLYYYLICRNTIDEKIVKAFKEGKDLVDYLISTRST